MAFPMEVLFLCLLVIIPIDCTDGVSSNLILTETVNQRFERLERLLLEKDQRIDQLEAKLAHHVTVFNNYIATRDAETTSVNSALIKLELNFKQKENDIHILRKRITDLEAKVSYIDLTNDWKNNPNNDVILPANTGDKKSEHRTESNRSGQNVTVIKNHDDTKEINPSTTLTQDDIRRVDGRDLEKIRVTSNNSTTIAFHAVMTVFSGPAVTGSALVYNQKHFDHGNGYSESNGLYVVPESGTYVITWTTVTFHDWMQTLLNVNGETRGLSMTDSQEVTDVHQTTMTVVLFLNQGDHVTIRVGNHGGGTISIRDRYSLSTFSGWKLAGM